jgi:uridine phosphorylase
MRKHLRHLFVSLVAGSLFFASAAQALTPELLEIQKKLYVAAFDSFLKDFRASHEELKLGIAPIPPPPFDEKLKRSDWITTFSDWVARQQNLSPEATSDLKDKAAAMFTSYYHDQGYSRVPYLEAFTGQGGSSSISKSEKVTLSKGYPKNHTLDVAAYVTERFPKELQDFVKNRKISLVVDDSNCADTYAYQKSKGYSEAVRFMGDRDNQDSQFLFVYNPKAKNYLLAICDIHGKDDQTRILAILGPTFYESGAMRVNHKSPAPLLDFNDEGLKLKFDAKKDRVVIGFQNTVWWQLKTASDTWQRRSLTRSGAEVAIFQNSATGDRVISVANVYGDEMLEALSSLYTKGARRFIYMGTAGGLDPGLNLGDVLLPHKFLKPDGKWFEFANDAEKAKIDPPAPAKRVSSSSQGWVGTLIEETRDHLTAMKDSGVQALDVESRYFAEFTNQNPVDEKVVIIVVSDQPMGTTNYNNENATRAVPMKSIMELVPQVVLSAVLKFDPSGPQPASVK